MSTDRISEYLTQFSQTRTLMLDQLRRVIVGQAEVIEQILAAVFTRGHCLLVGVPGLAKTLAVHTLARALDIKFHRIQFTPDLLPADVIGTQIYNPRTGEFTVKHGPVFANVVLADEINRAPAKVQSALLEAMAERQVTLGDNSVYEETSATKRMASSVASPSLMQRSRSTYTQPSPTTNPMPSTPGC